MKISVHKKLQTKTGALVIPVLKENLKVPPVEFPAPAVDLLKKLTKNKEFEGKIKEKASTYLDDKKLPSKMMLLGCGESEKLDLASARELGAVMGKYALGAKVEELTVVLTPAFKPFIQQLVEGILLAQYKLDKFKTKKDKKSVELKSLNLVTDRPSKELPEEIKKAETLVEGALYIRDLVNEPANIVDSEYLEKETRKIAKKNGYKVAILGDKQLKKMGWGLLLAVNQGSSKDAKCLVLQYNGGARKEKPIAVVGKGVIFDSGGYNLKPTGYMETMQQDMAGGATVLGLFSTLKRLKIKKNVVGIIPVAENMVDKKAYRPSDIIKSFSGLTVEITNTDAEGRLILADALTYAGEFKPEMILTIATLTGAAAIATGNRFAPVLANNDEIAQNLQKAGKVVDDPLWHLPQHEDYRKKMDSKVADVRNGDTGSGRYAGVAKGAAFLEKFVGENKWAHIDIGGTAFTDDPREFESAGATAFGFQALVRFLES